MISVIIMIKFDPNWTFKTLRANRTGKFFFLDGYNLFYVRVKFHLHMANRAPLAVVCLRRESLEKEI